MLIAIKLLLSDYTSELQVFDDKNWIFKNFFITRHTEALKFNPQFTALLHLKVKQFSLALYGSEC